MSHAAIYTLFDAQLLNKSGNNKSKKVSGLLDKKMSKLNERREVILKVRLLMSLYSRYGNCYVIWQHYLSHLEILLRYFMFSP